ncbi:MAG TPA: methyltransferase [Xanthobacteraceae bacterium]|jgi:tRNA1(Val) A37 N6-methylase TrmN6|nr:methyltransferase [Xanthobacteraceae bacterium]
MSAEEPAGARPSDLTDDAVLDGRLRLLQPRRGHRFGHDAILLAAATPARHGDRIADLGAGVGAAGLAVAARVPGTKVKLVEIGADLVALAALNSARNQLVDRVNAVALDIAAPAADYAAAGLPPASCDAVLMNPPFRDPSRHRPSPDQRRRAAHDLAPASLATWIDAAGRLLRRRGVLTLIFRADGLVELIGALAPRFGAVAVLPVHGKPGAPAIRIIVGAVKGSNAPPAILPGLVLTTEDGAPTEAAEAVLRHGSELPLFASPQ